MWTPHLKKWGSTDPLVPVAPRPLGCYATIPEEHLSKTVTNNNMRPLSWITENVSKNGCRYNRAFKNYIGLPTGSSLRTPPPLVVLGQQFKNPCPNYPKPPHIPHLNIFMLNFRIGRLGNISSLTICTLHKTAGKLWHVMQWHELTV